MRANEFVKEAEVGTPNAKEIESTMARAGYKKLGSGADATVWTKDESTVIKILMPDEPGSAAEKTFLKFYEFSQQHQNVPNLPKFYKINNAHHAPFVVGDRSYTLIAMERLNPIPSGSFNEAMIWILSDFAQTQLPWQQVIDQISDETTWEGFADVSKIDNVLQTIDQWDDRDQQEWGVLFTIMQMLYATGRINNMGWDLHTENVMQRKDGTLVIIDPWFSATS
jgi:hypothetical protein